MASNSSEGSRQTRRTAPDRPLPDALLHLVIGTRQAELAQGRYTP